MKVIKQLLAVVISLVVATPGWSKSGDAILASAQAQGEQSIQSKPLASVKPLTSESTNLLNTLVPPYQEPVKKCIEESQIAIDTCIAADTNAQTLQSSIRTKIAENKAAKALEDLASDTGRLFVQLGGEKAYCEKAFVTTCSVSCKVTLPSPESTTEWSNAVATNDEQAKNALTRSYGSGKDELKKQYDACEDKFAKVTTDIHSNMVAQAGAHNSAKKGMDALLAGGLGLAAGVGGMMLLKGGDKDKKKDEEDAAAAKAKAANGVIKGADGNEITCFSQESYTRPECKSTLISLCQGEKSNTAGCRAFEAAYCANEGSGSGYCLYAEAKVYCAQSGDMIASSPACTWKGSRPAACTSNPEDVSCLVAGTPEALTLSCANYPNDPLCKANASGRVVVQGGGSGGGSANVGDGAPGTSSPVSTTSKLAASSMGTSSMSSVIGGGSAATFANNASQNAGLQVIAGDNMWSTSSSAVQKACASGQLLNCL